MNDIIKKLQEAAELAEVRKQQELQDAEQQAQFEMENSSSARYYPGRTGAAEVPYSEKGYYINSPDQFENSTSARWMKLKRELEKYKK